MRKIMKKIVTILYVIMIVSTCMSTKIIAEEDHDSGYYLQKLRDYEVRKKNVSNTTNNEDFERFLDKVFIEGMEADFMTMHFSVIDYKKYGIEKPPVDLGEVNYEFDQENFDYYEDQLRELQSFDFDSLSYRQQYDYEALEYSIYETLADYGFYRYNFLLTSAKNVPEDIISNFTDYTFYDKESIDDYITCLKDIDRYFDDVLEYTRKQSEDGLPLVNEWIDYSVKVCEGVLNKTDDNEFIVSFEKRIAELDFLSESEKQSYCEENRKVVLQEVLPAYEKVMKEVEEYRGKAKLEDYVLCKLDKDYAELTYMLQGSNNKDLEEVFQELQDNFSYMEAQFVSCIYDRNSYQKYLSAMNGEGNVSLVGKECLEYLRKNLVAYYPDLGDVDYTVEELDPDTAPSTVIAYYWPAPVDNPNQNIIRTNPNNMSEGYETYGTFSHEGFPGHLYQHVYYAKTQPHDFRSVIGFSGYAEGWAVNATYYAYQFLGLRDENAAAALNFEDGYYFMLYSIVDIGTNYFGWSEQDVVDFFADSLVFTNMSIDSAREIRNFMIEMPGVYCSYGVGSSNFMTLCKKAQDTMKRNFDYIAYHDALLKNGPLPFNILEGAVDEYIEANNKTNFMPILFVILAVVAIAAVVFYLLGKKKRDKSIFFDEEHIRNELHGPERSEIEE